MMVMMLIRKTKQRYHFYLVCLLAVLYFQYYFYGSVSVNRLKLRSLGDLSHLFLASTTMCSLDCGRTGSRVKKINSVLDFWGLEVKGISL